MPKSSLLNDRIMTFYAELGGNNSIFKVSYFNESRLYCYLNAQDDRVMEYRGAIGATDLSDISQQIQMLVNSTRDRIITGIPDCCSYKYQILDTFCVSQSSVNSSVSVCCYYNADILL